MNYEEIKSPELNAAQNRVLELDKAFSRVLMYEAQQAPVVSNQDIQVVA